MSAVSLTGSTAAQYAAVQEWAEKKMVERLMIGSLDLYNYCIKRPLPNGNGKVVRWTRVGNFGMAQLGTEGAAPTAVAVSAYTLTATVKQRELITSYSDLWGAVAVAGAVKEVMPAMRDSISRSFDTIIRNTMIAGSVFAGNLNNLSDVNMSGNYGLPQIFASGEHGSISDISTLMSANYMTVADIRRAVSELTVQGVKPFSDGSYRLYCHPFVEAQLRTDAEFQAWNQYQHSEKMEQGMAGMVENAKVFKAPNAYWTGSGTATPFTVSAYFSILLGQGSTGVSELQKAGKLYIVTGADKSDPTNKKTVVGYKFAYAAALLNTSCGRVIVSTGLAGTNPPTAW